MTAPSAKAVNKIALTPEQVFVLGLIKEGADVWGHAHASVIRDVQRLHPQLMRIVKAKNAQKDGAARQPYFGAILTKAGRDLLGEFDKAMQPLEAE